jgi:hypothetical protein
MRLSLGTGCVHKLCTLMGAKVKKIEIYATAGAEFRKF